MSSDRNTPDDQTLRLPRPFTFSMRHFRCSFSDGFTVYKHSPACEHQDETTDEDHHPERRTAEAQCTCSTDAMNMCPVCRREEGFVHADGCGWATGSAITLSRIADWTHQFGAELVPRGGYTDTYGDGVRHCKAQVSAMLAEDCAGFTHDTNNEKENDDGEGLQRHGREVSADDDRASSEGRGRVGEGVVRRSEPRRESVGVRDLERAEAGDREVQGVAQGAGSAGEERRGHGSNVTRSSHNAGDVRVHELKTWPEYMDALIDGTKTFEVRKNDRDYRVGDRLHLLDWNPSAKAYNGREHTLDVTYVMRGPAFGVAADHVVMGVKPFKFPEAADSSCSDRERAIRLLGAKLARDHGFMRAALQTIAEVRREAIESCASVCCGDSCAARIRTGVCAACGGTRQGSWDRHLNTGPVHRAGCPADQFTRSTQEKK